MKEIDFRHHYLIVFDTETANTIVEENGKLNMNNVLMYDMGWCVCDTKGNVYLERSYLNSDIFIHEKELMKSAYYAEKIPQYWEDVKNGKRKIANTYGIRKQFLEDIKTYRIKEVAAHNARFDYNALNLIMRWVTKSKKRYFLDKNIIFWDTLKMSRDVILKMPTYRKFCEEHNLFTATGRLSATAENLYRFITKNPDFEESHTGLEDVQIEREILWYCLRQHKKMRKKLWEN